MSAELFTSGTFKGVPVTDAFAAAALQQEAVVVKLGPIPWPSGLAPSPTALGTHKPGERITGPVNAKVDALVVLYTEQETSALLDVFTGKNDWSTERKHWCGYGHNFDKFKPIIQGIGGDAGLKDGLFGYLSAVRVGAKTIALFKTELHPKQNGNALPIIPVMQQLITELAPPLVISTGTAGAVGAHVNCGDVAICKSARFHCRTHYPTFAEINTLSDKQSEITNSVDINTKFVEFAAANLTKLSLPGLSQCFDRLQKLPGYDFVKKNTHAPAIYVAGKNSVPGPQPMDICSADYLTVDDNNNSEGLQKLGVMNDTDDAFLFYGINKMAGKKPLWISVRNASEPQIVAKPFPPGTPSGTIVDKLKATAGSIYGIYQYCTTLNSAFACWGVAAGL